MTKTEWEELDDVIGVDSGHIILIDPCYILEGKDYDQIHNAFDANKWISPMPYKGGIITSSGFGDGGYKVFIKRLKSEPDRIAEIKVVFIKEDYEE